MQKKESEIRASFGARKRRWVRARTKPACYRKICVIGAPGVGKSTLLEEYFKRERRDGTRDSSSDDLRDEAVRRAILLNGRLRHRIIYALASRVPVAKLSKGLVLYAFRQCAKAVYRSDSRRYEELIDLAWEGFSRSIRKPANRMAISAFFLRITQEEIFLDSLALPRTVIFDDSMWQSIYCAKATCATRADRAELLARLPKPSAVVYCRLDPEETFERILERERNGRLNTLHQGLSRDEILAMVREDCENAQCKATLLRDAGVPVCELDMSEPTDVSLARLGSFIAAAR